MTRRKPKAPAAGKVAVTLVGSSHGAQHGDRRDVSPETAARLVANGLATTQDEEPPGAES